MAPVEMHVQIQAGEKFKEKLAALVFSRMADINIVFAMVWIHFSPDSRGLFQDDNAPSTGLEDLLNALLSMKMM